jgi:hypothetical protein
MASNPKSVTPEALIRIQDKINDDPEALKEFVASPSGYLTKHGIEVGDQHRQDLDAAMREMSFGPKSFDEIARMNKKGLGIGISISIRIRF